MSRNGTQAEVEVGVDQRALVNILARYPGQFDVLRELIQNADDAKSQEVELRFETESPPSAGKDIDIKTLKAHKWIIRNKGSFRDEDWDRLGKIAAGNKDPTKVGAFGVGFYGVLSKSDEPLVKSGGKSLQFYRAPDGKLCKKIASGQADDGWTSVELKLKEQEALPPLDDLAEFLISSVALLANIHMISVYLDQDRLLHIQKGVSDPPVNIPIPDHLIPISPRKALKVDSVQRTVQTIMIDAQKWAFSPPSTTSPLPDDPCIDPTASEVQDNLTPTPAAPLVVQEEITHDLYTATTSVTLSQDSEIKKGVESCLKSLPSDFKCKGVYFNSEQHQPFASSAKKARRFKHFVPQNNDGRLFIGQSTNQTTGIGLHFSSHYLPTMERGAIDLANGQIANWNEEVLWVSGFLARVIYEEDMHFAGSKGEQASQFGLETMARFCFGLTVPHSGVSQILQDAFFSCCPMQSQPKPPFPVVSDAGISSASDPQFRQNNDELSFLKMYRVLHGDVDSRQRSEIIKRYEIPLFRYKDIITEFAAGVTHETMMSFFEWWQGTKQSAFGPNASDKTKTAAEQFCEQFASRGVLRPNKGVDIPLKSIHYFTTFPIDDDLSHPGSIYIDVGSIYVTRDAIERFNWAPLSLIDWLKHVSSKSLEIAENGDPDVGRRLSRFVIQFAFGQTQAQRADVSGLVKDIKCIPTQKGLSLPGESYFDESAICPETPIAKLADFLTVPGTHIVDRGYHNVTIEHIRKALTMLGVRNEMSWSDIISTVEKSPSTESNDRLLHYLQNKRLTSEQLNDLKTRKVFYSQDHGPRPTTELHLPNDDICELGLPILALPTNGVISSNLNSFDPALSSPVEQFLASLSIKSYPSLQTIIGSAASDNGRIGEVALRYFLKHFEKHYSEDYKSDDFRKLAYIPTKARRGEPESRATPHEVFKSPNWGGKLKFNEVSEKLQHLELLKLDIKDAPTIDTIVECFETPSETLPDHETAKPWFEHLSLYGEFSPSDLRDKLSAIAFVPVENRGPSSTEKSTIRHYPPKECFIGLLDSKEHHRDIFPFVDFGLQGNRFLVSCCAKKSPDASDVARKMAEDPQTYLKALRDDTTLYLADLRTVASQFDSIHEDTKKKMRDSPMFLGFRQPTGAGTLLQASRVVISDWESRDFGSQVFLAPEEEVIKKMYHEMGSQFLGAYVLYDIKPSGPRNTCEPPLPRDQILRGVHYFISQQDQSRTTKVLSNNDINFGVKVCKSLKVTKTFTPRSGILVDNVCVPPVKVRAVSAAFDPDSDGSTLWFSESASKHPCPQNDVAIALCSLLLSTFSEQDVMLLASLIAINEAEFRRMYPNQGAYKVPDPPVQKKVEPKKKTLANSPQWRAFRARWRRMRPLDALFQGRPPPLETIAAKNDVQKAINMCGPDQDQDKQHDFSGCCQPYHTDFNKGNSHCKEGHKIKLAQQETEGQLMFFLADNASPPDPSSLRDALKKFSELIITLANVFELPATACCIVWEDTGDDLMAFNHNRFIFFNLFHYEEFYFKADAKEKDEVADWFLMMAHEIAHNLARDHDEYHGSLTSRLVLTYLPALRKCFPSLAEVTVAESAQDSSSSFGFDP